MLCKLTYGFVDDIMFSHDGATGPKSSATLFFLKFAWWHHQ